MHDTAPAAKAAAWLAMFSEALDRGDIAATLELFAEDCYWRDLVAFTWNVKTMEGKAAISAMLEATLAATRPSAWQVTSASGGGSEPIQAWFSFATGAGRGSGIFTLEGGKCRTILTTLQSFDGHEEAAGASRPLGVRHGADRNRTTWSERRNAEEAAFGNGAEPYCLIIGGGQGGIMLGARLKQLGVPTVIVEKNQKAGDSWRNRYRSLVLHDPVWYDHLPYIPFPAHWPVFTPKDKMGDWLEMYVKVMELSYWGGTECVSASFDERDMRWTVELVRDGKPVALHPAQLVFATGAYGPPKLIDLPGAAGFKGEILHSSQYADSSRYEGKKAVVIGAASSGHDVAVDLWEAGADVTMVQRSATTVVRSETLMELAFDIYSEAGGRERHRRRQGGPDRRRHSVRAAAAQAEGALRQDPGARRRVLSQARSHRLPARFRPRRNRADDEGLPHRLGLLCRRRRLAADHRRRDQDQGRRRNRDAYARLASVSPTVARSPPT